MQYSWVRHRGTKFPENNHRHKSKLCLCTGWGQRGSGWRKMSNLLKLENIFQIYLQVSAPFHTCIAVHFNNLLEKLRSLICFPYSSLWSKAYGIEASRLSPSPDPLGLAQPVHFLVAWTPETQRRDTWVPDNSKHTATQICKCRWICAQLNTFLVI